VKNTNADALSRVEVPVKDKVKVLEKRINVILSGEPNIVGLLEAQENDVELKVIRDSKREGYMVSRWSFV